MWVCVMKLKDIKLKVYTLTYTKDTKDLKRQRFDLTQNRDLRYKAEWQSMLDQVTQLREQGQEFSIEDIDKSEHMLKESLFKVGKLGGMSDKNIELDWQRIQLDAQYQSQCNQFDIHIEDL